MADQLKARGYPYNSVAVRIGFDMSASHPKPTFQAIRPLTDDEADAVLEMFSSDSVSAVLADNDIVVDAPATRAEQPHVPVVPVAPTAPAGPTVAVKPVAEPPPPAPVVEIPTVIAMPPPPPQTLAIQPFVPGADPAPLNAAAFASPTPKSAPQAPSAPSSAAPVAPAAPSVSAAPSEADEPTPVNALETDISSILAGLSALPGSK
jgi:hypothetical protein